MKHQDQLRLGTATTLDEPVMDTIMRDLNQVGSKLKVVLLPLGNDSRNTVIQRLRDWDLWGPLLVCLLLSITLSITAPGDSASLVFAAVFVIVWFGAAAVTMNAQLLGGTISFFQSVCILGYCVFPLVLSALACLVMSFIYKNVRPRPARCTHIPHPRHDTPTLSPLSPSSSHPYSSHPSPFHSSPYSPCPLARP